MKLLQSFMLLIHFQPIGFRLMQFPGEQRLWQEVHCMIEALQSDSKDEKTTFLTGTLPMPFTYYHI